MKISSPEVKHPAPYSLLAPGESSSSRLTEILRHIQDNCPYANLLDQVNFTVDDEGSLCLSGTVSSYYLRQVTLAFAMKAAGRMRVSDRLKVEEVELN